MLPALPTPPHAAGPFASLRRWLLTLWRWPRSHADPCAPGGAPPESPPAPGAFALPSLVSLPLVPCRWPPRQGRGSGRSFAPLLVLFLGLMPLLHGCGVSAQPPRAVLLEALSLQIQLTQDQVARALRLEPAGLPEVSRVRVEEQQAIAIGDSKGLRLSGRFDWRLAEDPIRVDSPFELYLQRGERGQSWRLARPVGSADGALQDWLTEPLPLPGERRADRVPAQGSGSGGGA